MGVVWDPLHQKLWGRGLANAIQVYSNTYQSLRMADIEDELTESSNKIIIIKLVRTEE